MWQDAHCALPRIRLYPGARRQQPIENVDPPRRARNTAGSMVSIALQVVSKVTNGPARAVRASEVDRASSSDIDGSVLHGFRDERDLGFVRCGWSGSARAGSDLFGDEQLAALWAGIEIIALEMQGLAVAGASISWS